MSDDKRQFVINIVRSNLGTSAKVTDEHINTVIDQQISKAEKEMNRAFSFLDGKMTALDSQMAQMDRIRSLAGIQTIKPMVPIEPVTPKSSWPRVTVESSYGVRTIVDPELELEQPGSYRKPGKVTVSELLKQYDITSFRAVVIPEPVQGLTLAQKELVEELRRDHRDCLFLVLPIQGPKKPGLLRRLVGIFSRRKRLKPAKTTKEFDISQCCDVCYGNGYLNMSGFTHPQPCPVCNHKEDYE